KLTQFMIDGALSAGYKMVTVGECLGDAPGNWYRDAKTGEPVGNSFAKVPGGKGGLEGKENAEPSGTTSTVISKSTSPSSTSQTMQSTQGTQTAQTTQTTQTGSKETDGQAKEDEDD